MGRQDDFSMRVFVSDVMNQPTPFGLHVLLRRMVRRLFNSGGALTAAAVITLALIIGFQLGGAPWRFRRQVWQLQGALMGTVLGFIVGRFSANLTINVIMMRLIFEGWNSILRASLSGLALPYGS